MFCFLSGARLARCGERAGAEWGATEERERLGLRVWGKNRQGKKPREKLGVSLVGVSAWRGVVLGVLGLHLP